MARHPALLRRAAGQAVKLSRRPPRQRHRLMRAGGMMRVFRATLEAVQEAQRTGVHVDVTRAEDVAHAALLWLRVVVASHWLRAG
jgi:hypothetical protein